MSRRIVMYQSAENILSEIMAFWKEMRKDSDPYKNGGGSDLTYEPEVHDKDTEIVYVCGFYGGCGKTTVALLLAKAAAVYFGMKALVINSGGLSDIYDFFEDEKSDGLDLGIMLMNFVKGKKVILQDHMMKDRTGVYCFRRNQMIEDGYDDLSDKEFCDFIEYIRSCNAFDLIIIDVNDSSRRKYEDIFKGDSRIVMVKDMRRQFFRTENIWYKKMFHGIEPVIVENYSIRREKDPVFLSEADIDIEEHEEVSFYYSPESFSLKDGLPHIDLSGSLGQCGAALYRKLFSERSK